MEPVDLRNIPGSLEVHFFSCEKQANNDLSGFDIASASAISKTPHSRWHCHQLRSSLLHVVYQGDQDGQKKLCIHFKNRSEPSIKPMTLTVLIVEVVYSLKSVNSQSFNSKDL